MAENIVVNGRVYEDVEAIVVENENGEEVAFGNAQVVTADIDQDDVGMLINLLPLNGLKKVLTVGVDIHVGQTIDFFYLASEGYDISWTGSTGGGAKSQEGIFQSTSKYHNDSVTIGDFNTYTFIGAYSDLPSALSESTVGQIGKNEEDISKLAEEVSWNKAQILSLQKAGPPSFANGVSEMVDESKAYVNTETGTFWACINTTTTRKETVTDPIVGTPDNPYVAGRLPSSGTTPSSASGYVVSPWIDFTKEKYQGKTIKLHFEGLRYITEGTETYVQHQVLGTDKTTILAQRAYSCLDTTHGSFPVWTTDVEIVDTTSAVLTIDVPTVYGTSNKNVGYVRFSAAGAEADSNIYITYENETTVVGKQWVDTHITYSPSLTEIEKQEIVNDIISRIDTDLLSVVGSGQVI